MQLLVELVIGITHQQCKALFATGRFDAAEDIDRVRVGDIGDDQANQPGTTMFQATGHQAGTVVKFGNRFFNARQQVIGKQVLFAIEVA